MDVSRKTLKPFLGALLFLAVGHAGVFIKDQQYRFCSGDECKPFCSGKQPACVTPTGKALPLVIRHPKYTMTFIEYRENGDPWDLAQYEHAKALIEQIRKDSKQGNEQMGPATVFLYVHGWKHNASDRGDDGDVARFGRYLEMYHEYVKDSNPRPVVGVYLSWRGRSLELPGWISWLTFWTRSAAARRVGNGAINDHIDDLVSMAIRHRKELDPGRHPYAFVIGHSFGARVLETAVIGKQKSSLRGNCKTLALDQNPVTAMADLVLFENAATSSQYVRRQVFDCQPCGNKREGCRDLDKKPNFSHSVMARNSAFDRAECAQHPDERRCQPYPVFLAASSSKDWLTRAVLFAASFQHPAAFFPWRQTHHIRKAQPTEVVNPKNDEVFMFQTPANGKSEATYMVHRKNTKTISPANPVWVIEVGKNVSSSHGDVWNATMMNMIVNLAAADGNLHGPSGPPPPLAPTALPAQNRVVQQPPGILKGK